MHSYSTWVITASYSKLVSIVYMSKNADIVYKLRYRSSRYSQSFTASSEELVLVFILLLDFAHNLVMGPLDPYNLILSAF